MGGERDFGGDEMTYEVIPVDGYGRRTGAPVYLIAADEERAKRGGRLLLRAFGQRGRFDVLVRQYNPLYDPAMRGYVRAVNPETEAA